jgi:hypothetical protein
MMHVDIIHTFNIKSPIPVGIDGIDKIIRNFINSFTVPMSVTFVTIVWLETV